MIIATDALVIGAGPAGLMAADVLSTRGARVLLAEAKPSAGRKLLMAGKSGLNITKDEPLSEFLRAYGKAQAWLDPFITAFGPDAVRAWAEDLGSPCFAGSSGRVFPQAMKASPLLRVWLGRLARQGVDMRTGWRWTGWTGRAATFSTPEGPRAVEARATVLALGGASWPRLGSDGAWAGIVAEAGAEVAPFKPANMGFDVKWSAPMARFFGTPVKPLGLHAGGIGCRGEIVITHTGIEGGGLYMLSAPLRDAGPKAVLTLDLLPDLSEEAIHRKLEHRRRGDSLSNHLRKAVRLSPVKIALLRECANPPGDKPAILSRVLKSLPVRLKGPRPLEEAISTAGGLQREAVDGDLMLRARKGVFVAGEMLNWEAPTGGYLLTACLATGRHAGESACRYLQQQRAACSDPPT